MSGGESVDSSTNNRFHGYSFFSFEFYVYYARAFVPMLHIGIIATVCQAIVRLAEYGLHFCLRGPRSLVNKVMCEYHTSKQRVVGGVSLRSPLIVLCIWGGLLPISHLSRNTERPPDF